MPHPVLSDVAARLRAGETLVLAIGVRLFFTSGTQRYWSGLGELVLGGETFQGRGEFLKASGLEQVRGGVASSFTLGLSGLPAELGPAASAAASEWKNRSAQVVTVYQTRDGAALGAVTLRTGTMQTLLRRRESSGSVTLTVTCEGLFTDRRRARWAMLSDRDQQARFPGDRGLEYTPTAAERTITWPKY